MKGLAAVSALLSLLLLSCGSPIEPSVFNSDDFSVAVRVVPGVVAPGDSAQAVAVFRNNTASPVSITFPDCAFLLTTRYLPAGERVELDGPRYGCVMGSWELVLAPNDSAAIGQTIVAAVDGQAPKAGEYAAHWDFRNDIPDLETSFTIR